MKKLLLLSIGQSGSIRLTATADGLKQGAAVVKVN